ncbi:class I SAM-dependent methyltransferase [soil metagenome]
MSGRTDPTVGLNPVAAGGFASAAPTYARIRPTYARSSIGELKQAIGTTGRVLDVAAGTGILTGQLARAGLQLIALEPVAEMLSQLQRSLPAVPAARGVAEHLPFAAGSVDAVVVGTAFHWFDGPAAVAEAVRILRPDGVLALLWNQRDNSVDWVRRYGEALLSERPEGRPYESADWETVVRTASSFGPVERSSHPNPQPSSPAALVERAASTSFVADAAPEARDRVLERVRALAATHPDLSGRSQFDLPYVTELYLWRRSS